MVNIGYQEQNRRRPIHELLVLTQACRSDPQALWTQIQRLFNDNSMVNVLNLETALNYYIFALADL